VSCYNPIARSNLHRINPEGSFRILINQCMVINLNSFWPGGLFIFLVSTDQVMQTIEIA
jgi:hypothetical protein